MTIRVVDAHTPEDHPDASLVHEEEGRVVARCSLWWRGTPSHEGARTGAIGHWSGASAPLLRAACDRLRAQGCTFVIGPMDGNTWRKYRFVTDPGREPPFLLEPTNPPEWPRLWEAEGFAPIAHYTSALTPDLAIRDPRADALEAKLRADGYALRTLRAGEWPTLLPRVYPLLTRAFAKNFLYTDLARDDFLAQYAPLEKLLVPETVLLVERADELVAFFFTYPDALRPPRDAIVLKTVAVDPAHEGKGIGSLLAARTIEASHRAGFRRGIHALMYASNRSQKISAHFGAPIREYALFGRPL